MVGFARNLLVRPSLRAVPTGFRVYLHESPFGLHKVFVSFPRVMFVSMTLRAYVMFSRHFRSIPKSLEWQVSSVSFATVLVCDSRLDGANRT